MSFILLHVNDALELALQAIDEETTQPKIMEPNTIESNYHQDENQNDVVLIEPIYEIIGDCKHSSSEEPKMQPPTVPEPFAEIPSTVLVEEEPYYQVPKPIEPYYEVPKNQRPIPVYENIEIFNMEPPKEKPPPPPPAMESPEIFDTPEIYENTPMKRMNSTKRIKKEIRNKRSSFLGIEGSNDDFLELTVAPPPDMAQLLQEERRLEKQLYMKAGLYESSDTGESRDSGVSENHSRQSSEPFTNSSEETDRQDDLLIKKEKEIIEVLEKEEEKQKRTYENINSLQSAVIAADSSKIKCIEDQIREQEEVLRVERELLQLEQEELNRQRENLMIRENMTRRELEHGAKMLMSANRRSLQDINNASSTTNIYANLPTTQNQIYQIDMDYRKSISDLRPAPPVGPIPPTKPMRTYASGIPGEPLTGGLVKIATNYPLHQTTSVEQFPVPLRNYQPAPVIQHSNMSRNTLHALSATPKPKYTDAWIQQKKQPANLAAEKRKSVPGYSSDSFNYNNHWLIQEAEQRRIEQQRSGRQSWSSSGNLTQNRIGSQDNKPLPEAVIQTITQRVQSKGIGERQKRLEARSIESLTTSLGLATPPQATAPVRNHHHPEPGSIGQPMQPLNSIVTTSSADNILQTHVNGHHNSHIHQQDKVLSVSGKKKCSHCGDELDINLNGHKCNNHTHVKYVVWV